MPWNPEPVLASDPDPRAVEYLVAMRDGVRLATDVYLPDAAPAPVVLVRTCYDKSSWVTFLPLVAEYLNERGYALVAQDVRGKFRSEGDSAPFIAEVDDGFDTLEWVADQPWCDGRIAMFGDSYYAWTAWAAVASGHPALGAVVSRGMATDVAHRVAYSDGAYHLAIQAFWAPYAMDRWMYDVELPIDWDVRPLSDIIGAWLPGRRAEFFERARAGGPDSPFWRTSPFTEVRPDRIRVPALHVGGWWEDFRSGQLDDWRAARAATGAPQYLLMDASDHFDARLQDDDSPEPDFRETEEGIRSYLPRYLDPAIAFLDRELRGLDTPATPLVRAEVVGAGWWHGATWPPPGAQPLRLHLGSPSAALDGESGGTLAPEPDPVTDEVSWAHDPQNLVPSLDPIPFRDLVIPLPDERGVESRPDVLTFTGPVLAAPLDLTGSVLVTLEVGAETSRLQLVAKLVDVFPSGRARRITVGARVTGSPDGPIVIDLSDVAYRLPAGHRLRLEVAASCFPRYLPVIDPVGDDWTAVSGPRVEYRLRAGGGTASHLDLTLSEGLRLTPNAPWEQA